VRVYATFDDPRLPLRDVPAYAARVERIGFHGLLVPEAVHDGLLVALLALEHTRTLRVATSVVLAFPRSPTITAYAAWDLQGLSRGRFALGLGSQVKANVVGRFGVEWRPPVARMRDYVGALRAVWTSWRDGTALDFASASYRLDRMQPFFVPPPIEHPDIPIFLGGVNPGMVQLAGEIADGLMTHPTNSAPRYLRERCRPALAAGAARAGRPADTAEVIAGTFVATGATSADVARERERLREYLGFLYSTPHYWPTLDLYGWREVGERLRQLTREGRWHEMKGLVTDAILDALVPAGTYDAIAPTLRDWYGDLAGGLTLRVPEDPADDPALRRLIETLAAAPTPSAD
jgi:probable F420-dependent oxidoreductase